MPMCAQHGRTLTGALYMLGVAIAMRLIRSGEQTVAPIRV